jgi:DNA-binding winged helix-turn-helix (wHTH) protein
LGNFEVKAMPTWRFAEFELDPENQILHKSGAIVKLAPQPYRLLMLLVTKSGRLVKRDELCHAIWGTGTIVDFEHGLNTCMRQVRAALGDEADAPRIIETVPRVGYRLLVSVSQHEERERKTSRTVRVSAAIAVMVTALGVTVVYLLPSPRNASPVQKDAHALYVRGLVRLDNQTEADIAAARALFAEAAKRDPASAEAQAGLARTYLTKPTALAGVGPTEARSRAEAAIERARARSFRARSRTGARRLEVDHR